jgi:hypothetical protein
MKTLALVTLMMPLMAFAKTADDSALAARLKRSEQNLGEGVIVKTVDKKYVDEAIKRVGGKATVEFGPKDQLAVGGVIVGSGADGLASRSNSDPTSPVVIRPPITPTTSITLVGKADSYNEQFCALPVTITASGEVLTDENMYNSLRLGRSNDPFTPAQFKDCAELNKPLRLKAGTYFVTFNNTFSIVQLGNRENKVIPLREISVPNCNCDSKVSYQVYRDYRSTSEVAKSLTLLKILPNAVIKEGRALLNPQIIAKSISYDNENKPGAILEDTLRENTYGLVVNGLYTWFMQLFIGSSASKTQQQGQSTFVLPGQYSIHWIIDGQNVYTPGIRID